MHTIAILTSSRSDHLEQLQQQLKRYDISMQIEEYDSPTDHEVMLVFDFTEDPDEQEFYQR